MTRRPWILTCAFLVGLCLVALPACKKKKPADDGGDPTPAPDGSPPAAASSDYLLFAQLRVKDIRDSAVFKEVQQAFAKAGGTAEWDKIEGEAAKEIGFKPSDIDTVTVCATEIPDRGAPKFVVILTSAKAIDKAAAFGLGRKGPKGLKPDARGFISVGTEALIHYPDAKTAVLLHPDLADQYLGGYAKDRKGWPMTAELSRAAAGHTLYAAVNLTKLPAQAKKDPDFKQFGAAMSAQSVTLTADLKGKELKVAARARFPDSGSANQAKDTVQKFIAMAAGEIQKVMEKEKADIGGAMPLVKEAHRALTQAKVEVSGSDLTVAGSYKADFDVGKMVAEAVTKVQGASERMKAQNNLKQIGIALHNYHSAMNQMPIHAVGAKGQPIANPKGKPLLSWRVAILPYIEQDNLYRQFKLDEPWDSAHNKKLIEQMPKIFAPAKPGKAGYTHLQMVVGPNAMRPFVARIPASFPDGTSNTVAVIEAAEPVIWTKPDDVMLTGKEQPKDLKKKFGGQFPGGFNATFWDGSVRFIRDSISDADLKGLLTPSGGEVLTGRW